MQGAIAWQQATCVSKRASRKDRLSECDMQAASVVVDHTHFYDKCSEIGTILEKEMSFSS